MLALRRSSRQVIVADKQLDGPDMVGELLGKRQCVAHQTGHALAQGVVEPLDVIGCARQLDRIGNSQIPPDFVVKSQSIDIAEVIV
jgi:hypothetical protein